MDPVVVALLTVLGVIIVVLLALLLLSGGNLGRVGLGLRLLGRALTDAAFADKAAALLAPPPPKEEQPPKPSAEPLRLLALLQREGRLVDFLLEDLHGAADEQLGAGVREIHRKCQHALLEHLVLDPVLAQEEGNQVEVPAGFDPSAVRLTGNVTGQPPFRGTLQHRGWRVRQIKLAPPPEGQDEFVLAPAEVELP